MDVAKDGIIMLVDVDVTVDEEDHQSGATFIMLYHPKYNVARKQEPATLRTLYTAHDTAYG